MSSVDLSLLRDQEGFIERVTEALSRELADNPGQFEFISRQRKTRGGGGLRINNGSSAAPWFQTASPERRRFEGVFGPLTEEATEPGSADR